MKKLIDKILHKFGLVTKEDIEVIVKNLKWYSEQVKHEMREDVQKWEKDLATKIIEGIDEGISIKLNHLFHVGNEQRKIDEELKRKIKKGD